jgi:hypothetical protein
MPVSVTSKAMTELACFSDGMIGRPAAVTGTTRSVTPPWR